MGESGENEELLAESLGAIQDRVGNYSRNELRLRLGDALVDFQHHIAAVNANAYETTALQKEFVIACEEAGRWGYDAPDCIVRSHRHRYARTEVPTRNNEGTVVTTPGWQLKTPWTAKLPGARQSVPQFGGILIRSEESELVVRKRVWVIERAPIEVPSCA